MVQAGHILNKDTFTMEVLFDYGLFKNIYSFKKRL